MLCFVAAILIASIPFMDVVVDEVDLVEINHFYDGNGRHVFDQLIFYDWDERAGDHQIVAWRMGKTKSQRPIRDERDGLWKTIWHDTQKGDCLRRVNATHFRETRTQYDPELEARKKLPMECRRELTRPNRKPSQLLSKKAGES
jgi:hypothetical protein